MTMAWEHRESFRRGYLRTVSKSRFSMTLPSRAALQGFYSGLVLDGGQRSLCTARLLRSDCRYKDRVALPTIVYGVQGAD